MSLVKEIEDLLPQTQCGECDFKGCRPYAEALVQNAAEINRCPPGGVETLKALGKALDVDPAPFLDEVQQKTRAPSKAVIDEKECIGCTKCIQACPVDAIIGTSKQMHAIIDVECTGCGLCVEPCPVDCIEMVELDEPAYDKRQAQKRYQDREIRLLRAAQDKENTYREKRKIAAQQEARQSEKALKNDFIKQALARVKAKKSQTESDIN